MECRSVLASIARRVIFTLGVRVSQPFRLIGDRVPQPFLLCWCALAVGVALDSLHDNEPMQADEPPIVRGDAPRGLFAPRWEELGLNVLAG